MNIEQIKQVLEQKVNEPETIMFNGFLHSVNDLATILAQHEELERLRDAIGMALSHNSMSYLLGVDTPKEQSK